MTETERKFRVLNDNYKAQATASFSIAQGYLSSHPERTVRIRIKGDKGYLTIKGKGNESGTTRLEWEKEISIEEAKLLFPLCEKGAIEKTRYEIPVGKHVYEVDEFYGDNAGLVIAEIELEDEKETFEKPGWLGKEVTGDGRYYNAYLSRNPYKEWKNQ